VRPASLEGGNKAQGLGLGKGLGAWQGVHCPSTLFGPTCDGADVICRDVSLPDLDVGDFVAFPLMGAYSWAGACNFNGIEAVWVRFIYVATP
jgi:diaminopimelate decarboxylase